MNIKKVLTKFAGIPIGLVAAITPGGSFPLGRNDVIEEPGRENCRVTVTVNVAYHFHSQRTVGEKVCTTYRIVITVTVREVCSPADMSSPEQTSTHTSYKEYCPGESDDVQTGETTGFDGTKTNTLTYGHGTKVTVVRRRDGRITVTIRYPDGTEVSTTVPP